MTSQAEKGARFRDLHHQNKAFILPNPWDAASARIMAHMGFDALASGSWAASLMLGKTDGGNLTLAEAIAHAKTIADAVDVPVSADLENGYGHTRDHVAKAVRSAAAAGLVGGSIEDYTGDADNPFYPIDVAAERIAAAVEAARALDFPFTVTARAENFGKGRADLDDTIARLRAYEQAGADVLYAIRLPDLQTIRAVCDALERPVNVLIGTGANVDALAAAGVTRISLGPYLFGAAYQAVIDAGSKMQEGGFAGMEAINLADIADTLSRV